MPENENKLLEEDNVFEEDVLSNSNANTPESDNFRVDESSVEDDMTYPQSDVDSIMDEFEEVNVEAIKKELDDIKDKYTRICADYSNFKRRHDAEISNIETKAIISTLKNLLPLFDGLNEMKFDNPTIEDLGAALNAFKSQITKIMSDLGIQEIASDGQEFDIELHSAVATTYVPGVDNNIVTQTYMRGYKYRDKVIRPAMVEVNST